MRPSILYPLFTAIENLQAVGPANAKKLEKLHITRIVDLLWHLPHKIQDRRYMPKIAQANADIIATLKVRIDNIEKPYNPRKPWRITASDSTGSMIISYFRASEKWITKTYLIGEIRVISGPLDFWHGTLQMSHPDYVGAMSDIDYIARIHPVWPLTAGITNKFINHLMNQALARIENFPEWQDENWLKQKGWKHFKSAITHLQYPESAQALELNHPDRARLAYDEILAQQLALRLLRQHMRAKSGCIIKGDSIKAKQILSHLPFELTKAQKRSLREILTDMRQETKMVRLLQGDVGSGKTLVALFAMATANEAGFQSALMAPTEILARQHYQSINELALHANINVILLTGREKGKKRQEILEQIATGEAHIIIGTHALIQEDVFYKNLAFAVIDEQHRFGVHQRMALTNKGRAVDLLVMTATPIPRSLMLSVWGDMESSKLDEKPTGRLPIETRIIANNRTDEVISGLKRAIAQGEKIYWVCPLVEETEKSDLTAAEDRYEMLKSYFTEDQLYLVHGKMKAKDKDLAMQNFKESGGAILVATTVIEVGVDISDATIMVIEHAERFGLAQLHQLRGRVGRNNKQSSCLLMYSSPLSFVAKERFKIMRQTNDGFLIAEKDLELRGAGEILGIKQSGMPEFTFADLEVHKDLLLAAADDVKLILNQDPELQTHRGQALRLLLYLFEKDAAANLLHSG